MRSFVRFGLVYFPVLLTCSRVLLQLLIVAPLCLTVDDVMALCYQAVMVVHHFVEGEIPSLLFPHQESNILEPSPVSEPK